jgi:ring-1,2-phenylacetyl-CoA epoxidase subunit PaaC
VSESAAPVPSPGRAVEVPLPTGDGLAAAYLLGIADDAMVYAQRLGEWLTNAPQIEEDMALANVSLDLLGQARGLYPHIGVLDGTRRSEDDFAMLRDEREWRNVHLVEQSLAGFGFEMARLLWFSTYQAELYAAAAGSSDEAFRGVAAKAVKEVAYHRDHAEHWTLRLGDGTEESHQRMRRALDALWRFTGELFEPVEGCEVEWSTLGAAWLSRVTAVLTRATLSLPEGPRRGAWAAGAGRQGIHTEPFGPMLAQMQHLHRSHPGAAW